MNKKFFNLPEEKRQRIINAGYRIFSQNSYKKSPVGEIAAEAGISKSLLFYYFQNKKELYLFLWEEACDMTVQALIEAECYDLDDLFEMIYRGMKAKLKIIERYPDLTAFIMKAFYEKEPELADAVHDSYNKRKERISLGMVKLDNFREGLDLEMMLKEMYWATEGYIWEALQKGPLNAAKLEKDFVKMIEFWKFIYLK